VSLAVFVVYIMCVIGCSGGVIIYWGSGCS